MNQRLTSSRIGCARWRLGMAVVVLMSLVCQSAWATFQTMADRLPAASNAIIAVNVAKLLDTPYAKSEEWAQSATDAWARQPLMIPPGSTRLLMASNVKTSTMESYWELSLIEMPKVPPLQTLAAAEGGYIDRIWDKDAVYSPINAYFVPLDAQVLASITPAERSEIARWVRQPVKPGGQVTSSYIKDALATLGDKTDILMAMDLQGAFGAPRIRNWFDQQQFKEIKNSDLGPIASVLATMDGITLEIQVDKDVIGRATVQFERDAAVLRECAKPVMIAVLDTAGMHLDDIQDWTFTTIGKQIVMQGPLSKPSLRRLLGIVQSPIPAATTAQPQAANQATPSSDPATASQRYYRAVCACLDSYKGATTAGNSAAWVRNAAKRIEQLPILNVDPALVEWGTMVTSRLRQVGGIYISGQTQINARVAGVMDPGYSNYDYNGNSDSDRGLPDPQVENAKRQRRQAALEQKAQMQEQAINVLNEIAATRPQIRAQMTDKYKVEF